MMKCVKLSGLKRSVMTGTVAFVCFSGAVAWSADEDAKTPAAKEKPAAAASAGSQAETKASGGKEVQNKLLKWTTLEAAFVRAQRQRDLALRQILRLRRRITSAKDEAEKKKHQETLERFQTAYRNLSVAMSVLFAVNPLSADYVYNPVNSNIYVRVGTLRAIFTRAVRVRDRLAQYIGEQQALKEAEKDEKKKEEIQKRIDAAVRQYRVVAAALQQVFGVVPQRSYQYDPRSSTLYLKVSEQELEKLRKQLQELQEKRREEAAKAASDKGAPEDKAAKKKAPPKKKK